MVAAPEQIDHYIDLMFGDGTGWPAGVGTNGSSPEGNPTADALDQALAEASMDAEGPPPLLLPTLDIPAPLTVPGETADLPAPPAPLPPLDLGEEDQLAALARSFEGEAVDRRRHRPWRCRSDDGTGRRRHGRRGGRHLPRTASGGRPPGRRTSHGVVPATGQGPGRRWPGVTRGHERRPRRVPRHRSEHHPHPDQPEDGDRSRPHVGHGRGDGPAVRRPRHGGRGPDRGRRTARVDRPTPQRHGHRQRQRGPRGSHVQPHRRVRHGRPADDHRHQLHRGGGHQDAAQRLHQPGIQQRRRQRHGHGGLTRHRGQHRRTAVSTTSSRSPRRPPSSATSTSSSSRRSTSGPRTSTSNRRNTTSGSATASTACSTTCPPGPRPSPPRSPPASRSWPT